MNRRRFLKLAAGSSPIIAGCTSEPGQTSDTVNPTDSPNSGASTESTAQSVPPTDSDSRVSDSGRIFVSIEGTDQGSGSRTDPLRSIQTALNQAQPGEEVFVLPGQYTESPETVRDGSIDSPISISGPPDAIFHGNLSIRHSHIAVTGLTFDGLLNPEKPDNPESYAGGAIIVNWFEFEDGEPVFPGYVRDVTIKPHAIGNTRGGMINFSYANDVEVGEFEIIGPGGVNHLLDVHNGHNGEVVYIGTPFAKWTNEITHREGTPIPPPLNRDDHPLDRSRNYHIHHIKHTAGHPHSELVDVKSGVSNVLVEYCTDAGGAARYLLPDSPPESENAISVEGSEVTLRWCSIANSNGTGIEYGRGDGTFIEEVPDAGTDNAIYGNRIVGTTGPAIQYETYNGRFGPKDQRVICGNEFEGEGQGNPDRNCPDDIPKSEQIGYLGGDSPWG